MNPEHTAMHGNSPGVIRDISPDDKMFQNNEKHYFDVMQSALDAVNIALKIGNRQTCSNILDFGCGYGRVLRGLRNRFPAARIVAADINDGGVDFCASTFAAEPLYLKDWPPSLGDTGTFDLIWSGSVFTHLPKDRALAFLDLLTGSLETNGLLVCTFHGRHSIFRQKYRRKYLIDEKFNHILEGYDSNGYGFYGEPPGTYGISVIKPSWLFGILENLPDIRILSYTERGWDNHQDVLACMKV